MCDGDKGITISDKFLSDQLQCIRLYWCFHEIGNVNICKTIERSITFSNKKIDFGRSVLTASDVECITVFFTSSSHKEWEGLYLYHCYIQDHGLRILHCGLLNYTDVTITVLELTNNGLTMQSSSLICDITVNCNMKVLRIGRQESVEWNGGMEYWNDLNSLVN